MTEVNNTEGPEPSGDTRPVVRSLHRAVCVPLGEAPDDRAFMRVFYPAAPTGSDSERLTGTIPPMRSDAPMPVVVFLGGVNIGSDTYRWLAVELATRGVLAVTFDHVGALTPGTSGLSPGLDLGALVPDAFGTRPSATVVGPVLEALQEIAADGLLAGLVDCDRVALGGHSAGATVALLNARPEWFPGVRAVFSYAGHTVPVDALGHPPDTVLAVGPVPALLVSGELDGIISASADRYGVEPGSVGHSPVHRTFTDGVHAPTAAYEVVLAGANHLAICNPEDPTTARGFLESTPMVDPQLSRSAFVEVLAAFLARHLGADPSADPVAVAAGLPAVASVDSRG